MKVFISLGRPFYEAYPQIIDDIKNLGVEVSYLFEDFTANKQDLIKHIKDADILINGVDQIDREIMDAAPRLKYILKYGTGVDNIDLEYASEKGIIVTNAPGQNAASVAEFAVGLILAISRRIPEAHDLVRNYQWRFTMGNELYGKRLGIIGFGNIGQQIAQKVSGFDMEVVAFGSYKDADAAKKWNVTYVDLDELMETSDYIVVSTSLKKSTYHLLNNEKLQMMKKSAYLINIARGDIIDEEALLSVLKRGNIKGAALDVFASEPTNSELTQLSNVIPTPHIGGATEECLRRFKKGEPLSNIVTAKELIK
ncbi:glycerate dehydrogenase [Heyndrickxia ginsengihumi]|uniref:Glycerate dehydrogenase n=1 Tax=Heyndrickxia ginsengihumi TaxID=363870 RepID=A0A0A6VDH8_9BACI|nr:phosphoglycerate dehydrogenase [Heyndrickxia ginsengihumi]KHD85548.1 glycerate dehydrogenase [Heyndrickxia ginsengihumi]